MRHLSGFDVLSNLRNGRPVEQLLPRRLENDELVIRFIRIEPQRTGGGAVRLREVFDNGNRDFIDIYEFGSLDPDAPFGEVEQFQGPEAALEYALTTLSADGGRFVNSGAVQDEYKDMYHPDW